MVDVAPGRDKQQNLKEAHHILRIKRLPPRAEAKIGAQLILKEIQKLAFKLHPFPAKLRRVILLPLIHKKLLLQPIPKIRQPHQQITQQIPANAGSLHNNNVWIDKDPKELLLDIKLYLIHGL